MCCSSSQTDFIVYRQFDRKAATTMNLISENRNVARGTAQKKNPFIRSVSVAGERPITVHPRQGHNVQSQGSSCLTGDKTLTRHSLRPHQPLYSHLQRGVKPDHSPLIYKHSVNLRFKSENYICTLDCITICFVIVTLQSTF